MKSKAKSNVQVLLKRVYYFDNDLYYKVSSKSKYRLVNKKNKLKQFIVLDVTKGKIYSRSEFILQFFEGNYVNPVDVINFMDTLKFKVYRKISKGIL